MLRTLLGGAVLSTFLLPGQVAAQTAAMHVENEAKVAVNEDIEKTADFLSRGSPDDRANIGFSAPSLQLSKEADDTLVSFSLSIEADNYEPELTDDGFYRVTRRNFSFSASTPIEEGATDGSIFSKDSVVSGSKFKLSFSSASNRLGSGIGAVELLQSSYDKCVANAVQNWSPESALPSDRILAAKTAFLQALEVAKSNPPFVYPAKIPSGTTADEKLVAVHVRRSCQVEFEDGKIASDQELIEKYTGKGEEFRERFFDKRSTLTFYGGEASLGIDDYEYLDRNAFELTSVDRTSWELGLFAGIVNSQANFSARAKASLGRSYELPEEDEDCRDVEGLTEQKCLKGAGGPPTSHIEGLISLETRHIFNLSNNQKIGLAPQLTYRIRKDDFFLEVPIYLTSDANGSLSGGIKFGYGTDEDELAIGMFIGIPFSNLFK